jgi:hypothetical protein
MNCFNRCLAYFRITIHSVDLWIGLREKLQETPIISYNYLMGTSMVSCRFSLEPIHWFNGSECLEWFGDPSHRKAWREVLQQLVPGLAQAESSKNGAIKPRMTPMDWYPSPKTCIIHVLTLTYTSFLHIWMCMAQISWPSWITKKVWFNTQGRHHQGIDPRETLQSTGSHMFTTNLWANTVNLPPSKLKYFSARFELWKITILAR